MMKKFEFAFQRTLAALMFVLVCIRIYVRFVLPHRERRWGGFMSEVFVIIAWVCFTIPVCVDATGIWDKTDDASAIWLGKWIYWWWIEYIVIYYSIKASMLLFYNEWIPRVLKKCWIANRILMGVCLVLFLVSAGIYAFWCWPISSNWSLDPDSCWSGQSDPGFFFRFAAHLFTDILIFALPIVVISQMSSLTTRKKAEASVMFFLGFFNILCACLVFGGSMVGTLSERTIFIFQNLDQSVGVLVVCCPALKVFAQRMWNVWCEKVPIGKKRRRSQRLRDVEETETKGVDSMGMSGMMKSTASMDPRKGLESGLISIDSVSTRPPFGSRAPGRIMSDQHTSLDTTLVQNSTVNSTIVGNGRIRY